MSLGFRVLRADRSANKTLEAGMIVYRCSGPDYGCSGDDTRMTGIEHVAMTLNEDGSYPFFTIPKEDLEEVV